jgi:hypothetical protein
MVRASPTELPSRDLERTLADCEVYLASSGAATQAANDGGGEPIPPSAATFGSFALGLFFFLKGISFHQDFQCMKGEINLPQS